MPTLWAHALFWAAASGSTGSEPPPSSIVDSTTRSLVVTSTGTTQLLSSGATRIHVYAYTIACNSTIGSTLRFVSGSTTELWRLFVQSPSSDVTGANLAVGQPAYLFRTAAGAPLNFDKQASSARVHIAVAAFRA